MKRTHSSVRPCVILEAVFSSIACLFISGCATYPFDTSGRDLPEFESVWQYLSAYSLWQDKVPSEKTALDSFQIPEALLASVDDTLHGVNYTTYDSTQLPAGAALSSAAAVLDTHTVYYDALTDSTAVLTITEFKQYVTYSEFLTTLPLLAGRPNIIIDLRNNGGGDINTVDSIMEYFLPVNTPYIQATYRTYDESARTAATVPWVNWKTLLAHSPTLAGKRLAVLMNGFSASASEILIAGLKDGRAAAGGDTAALVGETTYGKGIGQIIISRTYLGKRDLKITFLRLMGISSRIGDYHRKGIVPDAAVTGPVAQLSTALHILEPSAPLLKSTVTPLLGKAIAEGYIRMPAVPVLEK
ncbi:MAG TPA: S41 family peptidase [Chitinivibrionales bacterium]|nr:S41 family peptidase [Chitinivibrionales bacterium]